MWGGVAVAVWGWRCGGGGVGWGGDVGVAVWGWRCGMAVWGGGVVRVVVLG